MGERSARRLLPYDRRLVGLAVCDVLEQEGCLDFTRDGPDGAILADRVEQLMENELRLEPLALPC